MTAAWILNIFACGLFPLLFCSSGRVMFGTGYLGIGRNDTGSPSGTGSKNPVIPHKIKPRRRHQGRRFCCKIERLENYMGCPVASFMPEAIRNAAVMKYRKPFRG